MQEGGGGGGREGGRGSCKDTEGPSTRIAHRNHWNTSIWYNAGRKGSRLPLVKSRVDDAVRMPHHSAPCSRTMLANTPQESPKALSQQKGQGNLRL